MKKYIVWYFIKPLRPLNFYISLLIHRAVATLSPKDGKWLLKKCAENVPKGAKSDE